MATRDLLLLIQSPELRGGAQKVSALKIRSLEHLYSVLGTKAQIKAGSKYDGQPVDALSVHDKDFDEFVLVTELSELPDKAKVQISFLEPRTRSASPPHRAATPPPPAESPIRDEPTPNVVRRVSDAYDDRPVHVSPPKAKSSRPPKSPARYEDDRAADAPAAADAAAGDAPTVKEQDPDEGFFITLFCVYAGRLRQRAKALKVRRFAPSLSAVMKTLRQKFKDRELTIGYIDEDGVCVDLMNDEDLQLAIYERAPEDSGVQHVTLHCWEVGPAAPSTPTNRQYMRSTTPSQASRAGSEGRQTVQDILGGSSPGANGALDVSGACYNDQQLRALFDALDTSGDGSLDRNEFIEFFNKHYDPMGMDRDIFDKKLDSLLSASPEFSDGLLSFEEFAVIMLKVSQW